MRGDVTNDNPGNPSPELEEIDHPPSTAFDAQDPVAGKARAGTVSGAFGRDDAESWQRTASRADAGGRESRSRPPRPRSQSRSAAGESASRHLDSKGDGVFTEGGAGGRGRTYSGSSFDPNRWDPAINTIEREISELSERLDPSRGGKRLRLRSSRVSACLACCTLRLLKKLRQRANYALRELCSTFVLLPLIHRSNYPTEVTNFCIFLALLTRNFFSSFVLSSFGLHSRFHPHGLKKPVRERGEVWCHKSW